MKINYALIACTLVFAAIEPVNAARLQKDLSQHSKPATIKVLLSKTSKDFMLEVKGRYQVYNPEDGIQISSGVGGNCALFSVTEKGIKWGETLPGTFQVRIVPGDSQSSILVNGIQYRGCVEVHVDEKGYTIINEIDVENYLRSIMSTQFPTPISEEVMDALTIVERTNIYYHLYRNPSVFWHVTAQDSGYQGYALVFQNLHVDKAIESTRHMVLSYNNKPFPASWTKDSAGKTAEYASILRKEAAAPEGVQAPYAAKDRAQHQWSFALTKTELAKISGSNDLQELDLYLDKNSSKVYGVKLKSKDKIRDVDFFQFQKIVGKSRLLSNDFTVTAKGDLLQFNGFGEGHGVGLCLYSANIMAEKGEKAPKILSTFFPSTKLENMRQIALK